MKISALAFGMLLLAGTPVMAEEPSDAPKAGQEKASPSVPADSQKNNAGKTDTPAEPGTYSPSPVHDTPGAAPKN